MGKRNTKIDCQHYDSKVKGVQTYVAKENLEMAGIHQNEDIALLFGVFRSQRKLVHLMTSSRDVIA